MPKDFKGDYKVRSHHDVFRDLKDILANVHITDVRGNPMEQAGDHGDVIKAIENMYADFDSTGRDFLFEELLARKLVKLKIQYQLSQRDNVVERTTAEEAAGEVMGNDEG